MSLMSRPTSQQHDLKWDRTTYTRRCSLSDSTAFEVPEKVPIALQEAVQTKDSELAALRSALQQYEQKVKALELTNYSLSMHLRQATEANHSFSLGQRPPDVY